MALQSNETEDECAIRLQGVTDKLAAAIGDVEATEEEMGDVLLGVTLYTLTKTVGARATARRLYLLAISLTAGEVGVDAEAASEATAAALRRAGFKLN